MESFYSLSHLQKYTNAIRNHTCFHEVLKTHSSIVEGKENIILNLKY
jgi:hypothetical protein